MNVIIAQRKYIPEKEKNHYVLSSILSNGKRGHVSHGGQFQTITAEQNSIINHLNITSQYTEIQFYKVIKS